jgi:hypothetical protein
VGGIDTVRFKARQVEEVTLDLLPFALKSWYRDISAGRIVKNLKMKMIIFGAVFGIACSGVLFARETRRAIEPLELDEAEELAEPLPGFTGEELRRLNELRAWLAQRRVERGQDDGVDPSGSPGGPADDADRQLLTPLGRRYAKALPSRGSGSQPPILRIGRGPDGRIHHRYVFVDPNAAALANRRSGDAPADRRYPSAQSVVRIRLPELADQRTAPRLDYELPDQRR